MTRRDESVALRALIAATETHTELLRGIGQRLDMIDHKLDAVMGALTDHVNDATAHGEAP
jgi:hypothetical protein